MTGRAARGSWALLVLALVLGGAIRFARIERDLPYELETTTAPAEDAYWYLEDAQGHADGSVDQPLPPYDRPIWTTVARGWFAVVGTGIPSSNALGAACGTLEVLFLFFALRSLGRRTAGIGALLLATSYFFAGLSRTPLIYTPIATGLTGIWALWAVGDPGARGGSHAIANPSATKDSGSAATDRPLVAEAWTVGAWLLLAALAVGFKSVALVLAPGLILGEVARRRGQLTARASLVALGVVAAIALVVVAIPPTRSAAADVWEATRFRVVQYTAPEVSAAGLRAPAVIARRLFASPMLNGLVRLAPGLLGLAAIGAIQAGRGRLPRAAQGVVASAIGWILAPAGVLAALDYQPLRWFALVAPPLAALAAIGVSQLLESNPRAPERSVPARRGGSILGGLLEVAVVIALVTNALLLDRALWIEHTASARTVAVLRRALEPKPETVSLCLGLGLGIALAFVLWQRGFLGPRRPPAKASAARRFVSLGLAVVLVVATLALDLGRASRFLSAPATMIEANETVRGALGRDAVPGGPYASLLLAGATGRERRRAPEIVGGDRAKDGLAAAQRAGCTHVLLEFSQDKRGEFATGFAKIGARPRLLLAMTVRGVAVLAYRLDDAASRGGTLSPFEKACALQDVEGHPGDPVRPPDVSGSDHSALDAFAQLPEGRLLWLARARALLGTGRAAEGARVLGLVAADDPDRLQLERGLDVGLSNMLERPVDGGDHRR